MGRRNTWVSIRLYDDGAIEVGRTNRRPNWRYYQAGKTSRRRLLTYLYHRGNVEFYPYAIHLVGEAAGLQHRWSQHQWYLAASFEITNTSQTITPAARGA